MLNHFLALLFIFSLSLSFNSYFPLTLIHYLNINSHYHHNYYCFWIAIYLIVKIFDNHVSILIASLFIKCATKMLNEMADLSSE